MAQFEALPSNPSGDYVYDPYAPEDLCDRITAFLEDGGYVTSEPDDIRSAMLRAGGRNPTLVTPNTTLPIYSVGISRPYFPHPWTQDGRDSNARLEAYFNRTRIGQVAEPLGVLALERGLIPNYFAEKVQTPNAPFAKSFNDELAAGQTPVVIGAGRREKTISQSWKPMSDIHGPLPLLQVTTVGLSENVEAGVPVQMEEEFRLTYGLGLPTPTARV